MKIGVLTFHRCINYGSYWQARCLVEGLQAMGHDAELLDHHAADVRRAEWRCALQPQLPVRTARQDLPRHAAKTREFLCAFETLRQSRRFDLARPEDAGAYDAVVVGSDEVWNFRHPWYGSQPIFFGERLRASRLLSYAASFGNHDAEHGIDPRWAASLSRFDALSVRDENSRELLRRGMQRDPAVVLDPCLQFPPLAFLADSARAASFNSAYLAVYGHSFPPWFARQVRAWANESGRRVVSIGYRNDWADEQRIEAGPEEFIGLIARADAIATNFFHGCIFALLQARPFVTAPSSYRFNKVHDLVRQLGVENRIVGVDTPPDAIAELLSTPPDADLHARILFLREESTAFLARALA